MDALKLRRTILDIFFPPLCIKCNKHLKNDEKSHLLCRSCFDNVNINRVVTRPDKDITLFAIGRYDDLALRELLHSFKYNKFMAARNTIRALIKKYLSGINLIAEVGRDAVLVPIPLHPARMRTRGFNQSEIIAEELSRLTGLKVDSNILQRIKNTETQIKLDSYEKRRENLKDSFKVSLSANELKSQRALPRRQAGIELILVDDVYTSGATMKEAIRTLKRAGAENVTGFVIAKAG